MELLKWRAAVGADSLAGRLARNISKACSIMMHMIHHYGDGDKQQEELLAAILFKDTLVAGLDDLKLVFSELGGLQNAVQAVRQVVVTDARSAKSSLEHNLAQVRLAAYHEMLVESSWSNCTTEVHWHRLALDRLLRDVTALPGKRRHW